MRQPIEVELALLRVMADTRARRWWDYDSLTEALPDNTREQVVSGIASLRRNSLVVPHHRRLGKSDYSISTAGELLLLDNANGPGDRSPEVNAARLARGGGAG